MLKWLHIGSILTYVTVHIVKKTERCQNVSFSLEKFEEKLPGSP